MIIKNKYVIKMTSVYKHISHSAKCHNIEHFSRIFTCINKTESSFFQNCYTDSNIDIIEYFTLSNSLTYEVFHFNNIHKYGFKVCIHFNSISNYIIHSLYVIIGSFIS